MSIDEIKARLAAATPGPWEALCIRTSDDLEQEEWDVQAIPSGEHFPMAAMADTAQFIAHAPEDIARLIAALEAVGGALEKHGNPDASLYDDEFNKGYCAGRKALRAIAEEAIAEALEAPSE